MKPRRGWLRIVVLGFFAFVFFASSSSITAMQCGINIDPANGSGYPTTAALAGVKWVRLEYKDCTTQNPPTESIAMYRDVLADYKAAGIKTLVILDYITYPNAANSLDQFAERTKYIHQELGSLIDAYEIWNEPDIAQGGNLSPAKFAEIVNAVAPTLNGGIIVIGGFASGQVGYYETAKAQITANYSAVSVHPYAKSVDNYPPGMTGDMGALIDEYKNASGKPVWITEIGINTSNPDQLQTYLKKVFEKNYSEQTFWFAWSDGMVPPFGIVSGNGTPKVNYDEFFQACGVSPPSTTQTKPFISPPGGQGCGGGPGVPEQAGNGDKANAYPTSAYPPFEADALDYYLQPIAGLAPNMTTSTIRQDLALQGYQAYCATPRYNVNPAYGTEELITKFLKFNPTGVSLTVNSEFEMNTQNSQYPLFRDVEGNRWLTSSIEEFWGFADPVIDDNYPRAELSSAPVNSLLTKAQRCTQAVKTLYAIEEMCDKLENPSDCTLYERKIPTTETTTRELLEQYKQFAQGNNSPDKIETHCRMILADETQAKLQRTLAIMPLNIDRAYRLGFLVASIRQRRDEDNRVFNLLSTSERGGLKPGVPPHEVLVVAFKIPDILTNKAKVPTESSESNNEKSEYATGWNDPALLTRDILLPQSRIDDIEKKGVDERIRIMNKANEEALQNDNNSVYCIAYGDAPNGAATSKACLNPLGKAVVDIINAHELNCAGFSGKAEPAQDIADPAGLQISKPPVFTEAYGSSLLSNLFMQDGTHTELRPDQALQGFVSYFRINPTAWQVDRNSDSTLDFYLVYPVGYDLKQVEAAISGAFFTNDQIAFLADDEFNLEYFEMEAERQFSASTASKDFVDYDEQCGFDEFALSPYFCTKTFTVSVASSGYETIKLLGGRLGFWMRTIQRKLQPLNSPAGEYFSGCRTTEEFLLGRCGKPSPQMQGVQSQLMGSYCGARTIRNLTNRSENLVVIQPRTKEEVDKSIILDNSIQAEFRIAIAGRHVDGATLVTKNVITPMNPGQSPSNDPNRGRCGGSMGATNPADNPTMVEIWRLPLDFKDSNYRNSYDLWLTYGHILRPKIEAGSFTNVTIDVMVQPGIYGLRVQGSACHMSGAKIIENGTISELNDTFFIFDPDPSNGNLETEYCGKLTMNSNMPGGSGSEDNAGSCTLSKLGVTPYDVSLNSSCGGLTGTNENDGWRKFIDNLASEPQYVRDGIERYKEIFGRDFVKNFPSSPYRCGDVFPNTFQKEVNCDSVSNGDVESVGEIGDIPDFKIDHWKPQPDGNNLTLNPIPGSEITFKQPEDPAVVEAINTAAEAYGCDPLLVLAVLHSESPRYVNHVVENEAKALGIAQFTRDAWVTWWRNGCHQPPTFRPRVPPPSQSERTDIATNIDAACRLILWTNMQAYPDDQQKFLINFALQWKPEYRGKSGGNPLGQIWNKYTPQADYVYRLWRQLRAVTGNSPTPTPAGYPPNSC